MAVNMSIVESIAVHDDGCDEACAICFEERPSVYLPCACRISYCAPCWDRALAASVTARGSAQCPSCRSQFAVNFDPAAKRIVFDLATDKAGDLATFREQVYQKAKPQQIKILEGYGAALRGCKGTNSSQPHCVCGEALQRMSVRERVLRIPAEQRPRCLGDKARYVELLVQSDAVICDLCESVATRSGACWTCTNFNNTVMHPAACDICDDCFAKHTGLNVEDSAKPKGARVGSLSRRLHAFASKFR